MAKKKIYAVRKGHKTGLFETWAECQKATSGYSGAEFRGFTDREEAMAFLQMSTTANVSKDEEKEAAGIVEVPENMVIAYVDGSFEKSIGRYAFGCVILTPAGEEFRKSGSGCDPEGVKIRNVAGEMLGAMNAVQWAKEHEYPAVEIRYDYEGVEKWVTGVWRAKTPLTSKYAAHMQEAAEQIKSWIWEGDGKQEEETTGITVEPLGTAKHIFSHVQWDMVGYRVKIAWENEKEPGELLENTHFFMVDRAALKEEYSVPSAFGAYVRLLG